MINELQINKLLDSLAKSKFRVSFHLNSKMKSYVLEKGLNKIKSDAYDLIKKRLAPANLLNDGKQTPMRQVHPVFIAQHACACCCRGCLNKWYHVPKHVELTKIQQEKIVNLLMAWIDRQVNREC